ncbi:MAG: glycosyltransferase family 39 protein [Anaerolineae bacterium]
MKDRPAFTAGIVLLLITVLALGLRLYHLEAQSLWYDEGFSVYLARIDLGAITERTAADIQPPLYYYLLHLWMQLFGDTEGAVRSLSLLFGVATVPLLYAVAWQLFRRRLAGLLAALLIAISPLHLWYSQEARMYTLLTFLCLLSSYLLLRIVQQPLHSPTSQGAKIGEELLLWFAFTLLSVAAVYTHYFALLILAFQASYLLLIWWSHRFRPMRLVWGGLGSGIVILLAYLPWLPFLFTRYRIDASYWPGRLKLLEALLDISLSFIGGESVAESEGVGFLIGYSLVLSLSLVALVSQASRLTHRTGDNRLLPGSFHPLLFLLLYLLLPPVLILALSYNSPKFNARYAMISHPAFLLTLAGGLTALWQRQTGSIGNVLRGASGALSLLFILAVSGYADWNAYGNPNFARADFRGAVRYLRAHLGPDEAVVLCSGHMFPVFDYYAQGLERHLLPDSPTLDITRTLDRSIAAQLNEWLTEQDGVWLFLWQHEVVDPIGYLPAMLAEVGEELPVRRTFSQIELRHYHLPKGSKFTERPTIAHPSHFNFGNRLQLLGYSQFDERHVTLFWQALQPLDEDYRISLTLRDPLGQSWGQWDGRPTAYLYPTNRWREGEIVTGHYDLTPIPGTPPGDYGLEVGVYTEADPVGLDVLNQAGAPQGKRAMLGGVRLSVVAVTPEEMKVPNRSQINLGDGLTVMGWDLERTEAQPGDRILLTLFWRVEAQPQANDLLRILITDAGDQTFDLGTFPPTNIWHPTSIWRPGQAWRGQTTFRLPIRTQVGKARISLQLIDPGGVPVTPPAPLTALRVQPTNRSFVPPQPQMLRQANFDDKAILVGADLAPGPVVPGGTLRLTLHWQAISDMDIPYTVFVHLLGPNGQVAAGQDGQPASGTRPTTSWVPGEYIADLHEVPLPAELPSGSYVIEVGLYDAGARNMPRVPVLGKEGKRETDRVIFGPVQVP